MAVVWSYSGEPVEQRRFALSVSDAGELTIVSLDVLGVAEARNREGGRP